MVGEFPGLANLDPQENLLHTSDFRAMYCSLLESGSASTPVRSSRAPTRSPATRH